MKLCIPTEGKGGLDAQVAQHFGRCETYTVVDTKTKEAEVFPNTSSHMGGVGLPPAIIQSTGADTLVCRELGPRAVNLLCDMNIKVYVGASGNVQEVLGAFEQGKFEEANMHNACAEHRHEE